jgi:3-oxoadipate enol-lactonase
MTAHDTFVSLPNGAVRLRVHEADGHRLPLLWTHGMFHPVDVDDRSPLGPVFEQLAVDRRVVRYDTRGQGRTPAADRDALHRWDALADELIALADALHIERFFAGGISMGAAITLHAALRDPSRFAGLVLLAPPTAWETRPAAIESYTQLASLDGPEAVARQVERDLERDIPGELPLPLRFMVDELAKADAVALGRVLRAAAQSDLPDRAALHGLAVPTLLLPWIDDPGHPLETAEQLDATLPHTRMVVLEGVADTERLARAVQQFFSAIDAG